MVALAGCDGRLLIASHVQLETERADPDSSCRSSVPSAAAASWASGHTRTQPPSHIESPPPPCPKSLQLFFFYTVTYSRLTGSALAAPPLKGTGHVRQRAHVDDTDCASVASPSASDSQSASKSASTMAVSKMKAHRC